MARAAHVALTSLILGRADDEVATARQTATDAAIVGGRRDLLDRARHDATEWVLQAFAQRGYSGTWAATDVAVSVARPADRTAVAEALADAVTADVVDDLVDPDVSAILRERWSLLDESAGIPEPGTLDTLTRSLTTPRDRSPMQGLLVAALLLLAGFLGLGFGQAFGFALIIGGAVLLANALRSRPS